MQKDWFQLTNVNEIDSPALLVYPDRIQHNIRELIKVAGGPQRLTPHVKTIKMTHIVKMELEAGIKSFKCATIAEAEMIALSKGLSDEGKELTADFVLIAYQLNTVKIKRLLQLIKTYPGIHFASLVDNVESAAQLNQLFEEEGLKANVYMDVDNGMHRTGFPVEEDLLAFYQTLQKYPHLHIEGLHAYDGHINESDLQEREKHWKACFEPVLEKFKEIKAQTGASLKMIYGGTPTLPFTAEIPEIACSPGTPLLWDYGYGHLFPDLPFIPAAVLLTRIISKTEDHFITTDLGYKSISSENPLDKRISFLNLKDYQIESQSEEHLVLRVNSNEPFHVGDPLYAIPYHICPTVASYSTVGVVEKGQVADYWEVEAQRRKISI